MEIAEKISKVLGYEVGDSFKALDDDILNRIGTVIQRPDLNATYNDRTDAILLRAAYGTIRLDGSNPQHIRNVYVSGQEYSLNGDGIDQVEALVGDYDEVRSALGEPIGRRSLGRKTRRSRNSRPEDISLEDIQKTAHEDLSNSGINYGNIFQELGGVLQSPDANVGDVVTDLYSNDVAEEDIAEYLIYDSQYRDEIMARMYNYRSGQTEVEYDFKEVQPDENTFIGKLVNSLGQESAMYDEDKGVLSVNDEGRERLITNLPRVDEDGIFHNQNTSYIPHYIGYFEEGSGTRVERLRVVDPVDRAIEGVRLEYDLTNVGDVKFQTILDVSRNLPDFEEHLYGDEILDTLKNKVVLGSRYLESNTLLAEFSGQTDDLGAVALTMLDDDAEGVIDPYGTSNGKNLGVIFYLAEGAEIEQDGSIKKGEEKFSKVGQVMEEYGVDRDNFNRQQMSFNAMLTSLDVKERSVFVGEFGLWNSEDAVILTNDLGEGYKTGDKLQDMHGNKSTVSVVLSELSEEEIAERHLEHAVKFAEDNPHVDMISSPASLVSRMNMGVIKEGAHGETKDVKLPNGENVKDGAINLMYMRLPQTAESKSKNYEQDQGARRYSTLLRYALSAKVGDLYKDGLLSDKVRNENIDEAATSFHRLGVSFKDDSKLIEDGNVNLYANAKNTVKLEEYQHIAPAAIRLSLMNEMEGTGKVNIDLGEASVKSPFTGEAIKDGEGRNVLPIRVPEGGTIPYRYMETLQQVSRGNHKGLAKAYDKFSQIDYGRLVKKDNLLKNINTMEFTDGAKTTVIVPDPSIGLGDVRSNSKDDRLIVHRDPAIQSGNAISVNNVGGARDNVLHVNPLMINQVDGDFDGDTMGENDYSNIKLPEEKKQEFFDKSSVEEQVNHYGKVFLDTGNAHFKALSKVNGLPTDHITFKNGETNREVMDMVEKQTEQILKSPESYGAYAIEFTNEKTAEEGLCRLADEGIKGNSDEINHRLANGYSPEDNRALAKALIAKSEWTGLAGGITNNLISEIGEGDYELSRVGMDITKSMTQSVLQMKKDADRLPEIDGRIKQVRQVMNGQRKMDNDTAIDVLKKATDGLLDESVVDKFADVVIERQGKDAEWFGQGVINDREMSTTKLSYSNVKGFSESLSDIGEKEAKELENAMDELNGLSEDEEMMV